VRTGDDQVGPLHRFRGDDKQLRSYASELVPRKETCFTTVTIDHRSGPGIWVDMTTYWSYRLSANESAIWRRILKHSD